MANQQRSPWALIGAGLGLFVLAFAVVVLGAGFALAPGFLLLGVGGLLSLGGLALLIAGAISLGVRASRA